VTVNISANLKNRIRLEDVAQKCHVMAALLNIHVGVSNSNRVSWKHEHKENIFHEVDEEDTARV